MPARGRADWLTIAFISASLALATGVEFILPRGYLTPSLYAIPMMIVARRGSPRLVMLVGAVAAALYLPSALRREESIATLVVGILGLLAIAVLAIELARHRLGTLRRATTAEEADAESRRILESISDGFVALDAQGRFTYVNRRAEQLLKVPREELLGNTLQAALPDADDAFFVEMIREALSDQVARQFEAYCARADVWLEVRVSPSDGGVTVYVRDVTERHRAERAREEAAAARAVAARRVAFLAEMSRELAAVEPNYQAMLQRVADLAAPELADWCLIYLADPVAGFRRVAVAHADPADAELAEALLAAPIPARTQALLNQLLEGQGPMVGSAVDWATTRRDLTLEEDVLGRAFDVSSFVAVPLVPRNRMLGAIVWLRRAGSRPYEPIDSAFLEEVARRSALSVDNARLYQEAREAIKARDEFLSVAAHELRTPLTSIKGYIQLLDRRLTVEQPDIAALRASMEKLRPQLARFERIVRDLLDISRIDRGNLALQREPCDLAALAREVFDAVEHSVDHDPAQPMRLSAPDSLMGIWDGARITQVLANLLSNALKFSGGRGEIVMEIRREDAHAVICVRDQGVGMTKEEQSRVFEPFFRADSIVGHIPGTGLGLHITKRIVELHGGSITVESTPRIGSTFTVRLPLTPPDPMSVAPPSGATDTARDGG
ncbi:ATP-binding protein [Sphaerobacter sp.]|uniref:sensor histidine kinase n=1 Tax=Sphaerobacter sp. TaxID=2099654 RepID=UPI001DD9F517|nr:ATP-binding protein [Sphaerobacter sp.]MBX5444433.1 PAS domain-containing protein [Sphaerobacter sp.]